jgi:molybdenum cofactor guanylyltransferase
MSSPIGISGFVLAGGRSSRMGRDKALVSLAGKPLIEHAVTKLRRLCADVSILSDHPALTAFAPIVPDIHPNCGPIGGIEAALTHTTHEWNLFLPVDAPFIPAALLALWTLDLLTPVRTPAPGIRIFTCDGRPQPGLCLVHKAILPLISRAVQREEFALISAFEEAGREPGRSFSSCALPSLGGLISASSAQSWQQLTAAQMAARHLWFLNLNTKEDLALAEAHISALDT